MRRRSAAAAAAGAAAGLMGSRAVDLLPDDVAQLGHQLVGMNIEVMWPRDNEWYSGLVTGYTPARSSSAWTTATGRRRTRYGCWAAAATAGASLRLATSRNGSCSRLGWRQPTGRWQRQPARLLLAVLRRALLGAVSSAVLAVPATMSAATTVGWEGCGAGEASGQARPGSGSPRVCCSSTTRATSSRGVRSRTSCSSSRTGSSRRKLSCKLLQHLQRRRAPLLMMWRASPATGSAAGRQLPRSAKGSGADQQQRTPAAAWTAEQQQQPLRQRRHQRR
ncbi:hypothetical protein COO60DRAFT_866427 [Scenedesmus sp. NREL 46B-D3]|nr:hypothetical protein COO60DRAFT_866427 [Scenedesmus sp. NREL 46B-D3]